MRLHTGGCSPYKKNESYMSDQYVPAESKSTGKEGAESGEKYENNNNRAAQLHTNNKMDDTTMTEDHECYDD